MRSKKESKKHENKPLTPLEGGAAEHHNPEPTKAPSENADIRTAATPTKHHKKKI